MFNELLFICVFSIFFQSKSIHGVYRKRNKDEVSWWKKNTTKKIAAANKKIKFEKFQIKKTHTKSQTISGTANGLIILADGTVS